MLIRVWMRTAVRKKVTSFGTFLSTLCHEFCHHLDFKKLGFVGSWHTRGFYERAGVLYHYPRGTPLPQSARTKLTTKSQLAYDMANPTKANGNGGGTQYCTHANQCGCTYADFAPIVEQDPLIGYACTKNSSGVITSCTASPYAQTTDPTTLDGSGKTTCEENPIPKGSNRRYVMVPADEGSIAPFEAYLNEPEPYSHMVTDTNTSAVTDGVTESYSETETGGFSLPFFSLKTTDTWTWTYTESTGTTTGSANSMNLGLQTKTASCEEWVALYEGTI